MSDPESDFEPPKYSSTQMSPKKINMDKDKFAGQLKGMNINTLLKMKAMAAMAKPNKGILQPAKDMEPITKLKLPSIHTFEEEVDSSYFSDVKISNKKTTIDKNRQGKVCFKDNNRHESDDSTDSDEDTANEQSFDEAGDTGKPHHNKSLRMNKEKTVSPPKTVMKSTKTIISSNESDDEVPLVNSKKNLKTNPEKDKHSLIKSPKIKIVSNMVIKNPGQKKTESVGSSNEESSNSSSGDSSLDEDSNSEQNGAKSFKEISYANRKSKVPKSTSSSGSSSSSNSGSSSSSGSSSEFSSSSGSSSRSSSSGESSSDDENEVATESNYVSTSGMLSSDDDSDSSVDEPTIMDESLIKATMHRNKLLENYVEMQRLEAATIADCFNLKHIHPDCEIFTVKISKELDPQSLLNQNFTFERKQNLKMGDKHLLIEFDKDNKDTICLLRPKNKGLGIVHLRTKGSLCINSKLKIDNNQVMVLNKNIEKQTVPFPSAKLKPRHPIFGESYEKKIDLDPEIAKRLDTLIQEKTMHYEEESPPDTKEKISKIDKKKKRKRKSDTGADSSDIDQFLETSRKKKKSKHKQLQIDSILQSFNVDTEHNQVAQNDTNDSKKKKKKKDKKGEKRQKQDSLEKSNDIDQIVCKRKKKDKPLEKTCIKDKSLEKKHNKHKSRDKSNKIDKSLDNSNKTENSKILSNNVDSIVDETLGKKKSKKKNEQMRPSVTPEKQLLSPPPMKPHNKHFNKVLNSTMYSPSANKAVFDANESAISPLKIKKSKSRQKDEILKFIDETVVKNTDLSKGNDTKAKRKRRYSVMFEKPEDKLDNDTAKERIKIRKRRPTVV